MCINTEWGRFGDDGSLSMLSTRFDACVTRHPSILASRVYGLGQAGVIGGGQHWLIWLVAGVAGAGWGWALAPSWAHTHVHAGLRR